MLKKLLLAVATGLASMSFAFAGVDVNKADQAALDGIKGIGPAMSKAILAERKKGGNFKDWSDLQTRVKGIGDKSSEKFSHAGLTVDGAAKPGAAKTPAAKNGKTADIAPPKQNVSKKDDKPAKP